MTTVNNLPASKPTSTRVDTIRSVSLITDQPQATVKQILNAFFDQVIRDLAAGNRVELRRFGIWETYFSKARPARNPKRPEDGDIMIPSRAVIRFKPGRELKAAITQLKLG